MFGIMSVNGTQVLCRGTTPDTYVLKRWDRNGFPIMRESALEIDQLMQDFMTYSGHYDLIVFTFTQEQQEQLLVKRLRGY